MKKLVSILIVFVLFFNYSCSEKDEKKVDFELIPESTMSKILFDLHMNDGIINAFNNQDKSNIFLSKKHYEDKIYKKYGYTDTIFKMNIKYYTMNTKIKDIYSVVIDSMNIIKGKLEQKRQQKRHSKIRNDFDI
jgi:hypothetical protein